MSEFYVVCMRYEGEPPAAVTARFEPFSERYADEYIRLYNEAFREMRKALDIKPYDFYTDISQLRQTADNTLLLLDNDSIAGAVSTYGGELDDLFVSAGFQGRGLGRLLLREGMRRILGGAHGAVTLHAAEWNTRATALYSSEGFTVIEREHIII